MFDYAGEPRARLFAGMHARRRLSIVGLHFQLTMKPLSLRSDLQPTLYDHFFLQMTFHCTNIFFVSSMKERPIYHCSTLTKAFLRDVLFMLTSINSPPPTTALWVPMYRALLRLSAYSQGQSRARADLEPQTQRVPPINQVEGASHIHQDSPSRESKSKRSQRYENNERNR